MNDAPPPKDPPAALTQTERDAGYVRAGVAFGRAVVYFRDGTYSYRDAVSPGKGH